jgi:hypothetical protein
MKRFFEIGFYFTITCIYFIGFRIDADMFERNYYLGLVFAYSDSFGGRKLKLLEYLNMVSFRLMKFFLELKSSLKPFSCRY